MMSWSLPALLVLLASVDAGREFVFFSNTPPVPNYYFTASFQNDVLPLIKMDFPSKDFTFAFTYPSCPGNDCSSFATMDPKKGVEALQSATWGDEEITAHVGNLINPDLEATTVVISFHAPIPAQLKANHPKAAYYCLQVGSSPSFQTEGQIITIPFRRAAYLSGVIAALVASSASWKVSVLALNNTAFEREIGAFRQGVADTSSDVCVKVERFTPNGTTAYSDVVNRVVGMDVDVLYSVMELWDQPAMLAVGSGNHSKKVLSITGPFTGAAVDVKDVGAGWLNRDVVDWYQTIQALITTLVAGQVPRHVDDTSTALWLASPESLPNGTRGGKEMNTLCGGDYDTRLDAVKAVASFPISPVSLGPEPGNGTECVTPPPQLLPSTTDTVRVCLNRQGIRLVGLGVYITGLGNVDMKAGSYYVDFNLYMHQMKKRYRTLDDVDQVLQYSQYPQVCKENSKCLCPDMGQNDWENYIPDNSTALFTQYVNLVSADRLITITPVMKSTSTGARVVDYFRVQGAQYFAPQLSNWPLDTQTLFITVEDLASSVTDTETLVFCHMDHYSGLSPKARYFPGMSLTKSRQTPWQADISTSCWPYLKYPHNYADGTCSDNNPKAPQGGIRHADGDITCSCLGGTKASSRYSFNIEFQRPKLPAFLKTLLPPLFITMVNQGVWFLHPRVFETRLGVCGSSLISSVMFHVSLAGNTPETSVLTWADRFMAVVYYNNLLCFVLVFFQTILWQARYEIGAKMCYRFTRMWGPLTVIISLIGVRYFNTSDGLITWVLVGTIVTFILVLAFRFFLVETIERRFKDLTGGLRRRVSSMNLAALQQTPLPKTTRPTLFVYDSDADEGNAVPFNVSSSALYRPVPTEEPQELEASSNTGKAPIRSSLKKPVIN